MQTFGLWLADFLLVVLIGVLCWIGWQLKAVSKLANTAAKKYAIHR
jgi:hypothetical protein